MELGKRILTLVLFLVVISLPSCTQTQQQSTNLDLYSDVVEVPNPNAGLTKLGRALLPPNPYFLIANSTGSNMFKVDHTGGVFVYAGDLNVSSNNITSIKCLIGDNGGQICFVG